MKKSISDIDNKIKKYSTFSNMMYCFKCTKEYLPVLLLWTCLSILVKVLLPVIEMYLPKVVISEITSGNSVQSLIFTVLFFTIAIAVLSGFAKFCAKYVYQHKLLMGSYYMRKISNKGLKTDYENQENETFRKLQQESFQTTSTNESALRNVYYSWIGFFSGLLGFIVYFAFLARLNILIVLFLIISTVASYFVNNRVNKWSEENNLIRTGYNQKLGYIDTVAEEVKAAKDIRLYNMEPWLQGIYSANIEKIAKWFKRYKMVVLKTSVSNSGISFLREGLAYAYLLFLAFNKQIDVGDFVLYFAAITGFSAWLQGIMTHLNEMNRISLSINRFRSYLEFPEKFIREGGKSANEKSSSPCKIELKNVSYRYVGAENDTLHNLNLTILPGEHLGIVGLNGAGKTTLVKLICGLCDPTEGEILYDGINIKAYNRKEYYNLFSAVFQQFSILPLSIEEIVTETAADNINSDNVKEYLQMAGLWEKVESLPKGQKTLVNKSIYDNGIEFSGGETQKLILARAIYKNSPVLILDEPTAALDPISENKLYETYHEITNQKTSVFISHRLASTRFCSRILLINGGIIEEEGTHEELLMKKGLYSKLFETQAKYYRENHEKEVQEDEAK